MKKLLLTGFEPFGGETINPAWEAAKLVNDHISEWEIHKLRLPVTFSGAAERTISAAKALNPDVILCVGQAGGRKAVTPELVAINLRFANIPDNSGCAPRDESVIPSGPDGLFATVPARQMAEAIRAAGVPGQISYSAGAYVCNDLLYSLLYTYRNTRVRVGFVHVPFLPEQAKENQPSLPLPDIVKALEAAIGALQKSP